MHYILNIHFNQQKISRDERGGSAASAVGGVFTQRHEQRGSLLTDERSSNLEAFEKHSHCVFEHMCINSSITEWAGAVFLFI